jgi:hypothetical protein
VGSPNDVDGSLGVVDRGQVDVELDRELEPRSSPPSSGDNRRLRTTLPPDVSQCPPPGPVYVRLCCVDDLALAGMALVAALASWVR